MINRLKFTLNGRQGKGSRLEVEAASGRHEGVGGVLVIACCPESACIPGVQQTTLPLPHSFKDTLCWLFMHVVTCKHFDWAQITSIYIC